MQKESPIFFLSENDIYSGNAPHFLDNSSYPAVKRLEDNWHIITEEFGSIIKGEEKMELSSPYPPNLSEPNAWKNVYFFNFLWQYHNNCKKYPKTFQLLASIPNLTMAEVTVLEPHTRILPHIGETNVNVRGHLGLKIPATLPVMGLQVGDEQRSWTEGKAVLFSDAHRHTVWNNSNERRFVLVFDIIKDEYTDKKLWYCSQALSSLVIKAIDEKNNFFTKLPKSVLYRIHLCISTLWFLYLPVQRRLKFLSP